MKEKVFLKNNKMLMKEWNYEKNINISPENVTIGSEKKVWWKCEKGHEWEAAIYSRIAGNKCPICSGRKVLAGYNDLATLKPEIAKQWHPEKNKDITAKDVTINSHKKIWWIGECGHEWIAPVSDRTRGRGCPICKSKKVVAGINDIGTTHPNLMKEWHLLKNEIKPTEILAQSNKAIWWICDKGHEYKSSPAHRTGRNQGCPICSNKQVLIGYNDLATTHPELIKEWHPTKNKGISFFDISSGSNKKVWWRCEKGHEWKSVIYSRCSGCGCPICKEELKTSFPENAFFFYLKLIYKDSIKSYKADWLGRMELDIYIPSLNIAIEYDGQAWHNDTEKDIKKNKLCIEHGIRLIRIREPKCPYIDGEKIVLEDVNDEKIEQAIVMLLNDYLKYTDNIDVDIKRDRMQILNVISYYEKKNSFAEILPELVKEWHPILNGNLKPENVSFGSNKKIWWKCKNGHEWLDTCNHRRAGRSCPVCSKNKINNNAI